VSPLRASHDCLRDKMLRPIGVTGGWATLRGASSSMTSTRRSTHCR